MLDETKQALTTITSFNICVAITFVFSAFLPLEMIEVYEV